MMVWQPKLRNRRRGSALYITVVSTALIVSLLGLAGIALLRIERRQAESVTDLMIARSNARSAVELALRVVNNDPNWRTTYLHGVETPLQSLGPAGRGTVSWVLEDSDADLTNADADLRLKGVGRVGAIVQVSSVGLTAPTVSTDYLRCPIHASGRLNLTEYVDVVGGPFSSNTDISSFNENQFKGRRRGAGLRRQLELPVRDVYGDRPQGDAPREPV